MSVRLTNVSVARALDAILRTEPYGRTFKLGYWIGDEKVEISTEEDQATSTVVTRLYDIGDLIQKLVGQDRELWAEFSRSFCFPSKPQSSPDVGPITRPDARYLIVRLVTDTVAIDTWRDNGGSIGAIGGWGNNLLVVQSAARQDEIEALLDALAQAPPLSKPSPFGVPSLRAKRIPQWRQSP